MTSQLTIQALVVELRRFDGSLSQAEMCVELSQPATRVSYVCNKYGVPFRPDRDNTPWTEEQVSRLEGMRWDGKSWDEISAALGRGPKACEGRAHREGFTINPLTRQEARERAAALASSIVLAPETSAPWWKPGPALLKVAHEIRDEMVSGTVPLYRLPPGTL